MKRIILAGILFLPLALANGQFVWTGGSSTDGNWSRIDNWQGSNVPVNSNGIDADVVMAGTTRLEVNVDGGVKDLRSLTFAADAGSFTLSGGLLRFAQEFGLIENLSGITQTILNDVRGNRLLTIRGNGTLDLAGSFNIAGGEQEIPRTLLKQGAGTLRFSGAQANEFLGLTRLEGGTIELAKSPGVDAIGGTINISGGTLRLEASNQIQDVSSVELVQSGSFNLNGFSETIANLRLYNGGLQGAAGLTITNTMLVGNGGVVAPGVGGQGPAVQGTAILGEGGTFRFEINSAAGDPGTNWSFWEIAGNLQISATAVNPFTIQLLTQNSLGSPGLLTDLVEGTVYQWQFLQASGGISGFDSELFAIDRFGFLNDTHSFQIAQIGDGLYIQAIPEPETYAMLLTGLIATWLFGRRRRRA